VEGGRKREERREREGGREKKAASPHTDLTGRLVVSLSTLMSSCRTGLSSASSRYLSLPHAHTSVASWLGPSAPPRPERFRSRSAIWRQARATARLGGLRCSSCGIPEEGEGEQ
jgi:hypothetical protein